MQTSRSYIGIVFGRDNKIFSLQKKPMAAAGEDFLKNIQFFAKISLKPLNFISLRRGGSPTWGSLPLRAVRGVGGGSLAAKTVGNRYLLELNQR